MRGGVLSEDGVSSNGQAGVNLIIEDSRVFLRVLGVQQYWSQEPTSTETTIFFVRFGARVLGGTL